MKRKKIASVMLASAMLAATVLGSTVQGAAPGENAGLTEFEQAFLEPDTDAKPFMRWWIAPGRMTEEEVRREVKNFADGGYAGVELQCLELAKNCVINDATWNQTMKWILQAGLDFGVQVDFTVGQMWPVATPEITDADDPRAEQQIWEAGVDFEASGQEGSSMIYTSESLALPASGSAWRPGFDSKRAYSLIGITAAKVLEDKSYDPDSVVDVLADANTEFDASTGEISWTAPSEGAWKIFYFYSQTANHTLGYGMEQYVIDHMSAEGTQAVIDNWEKAMDSDPELKSLYEQNGGSIFGDSFELRSSLWTPKMLEEFKTRRGYDLTPYLPAINNNLGAVGDRVRDDLYTTMTELMSENHMGALQTWAKTHNMTVRYQAYSSAGSSMFELTYPALNIDIVEAESYAMSGTVPDSYRQLSGIVHMKKDSIYSAEAAEIGQDDWRETWTDTQLKNGGDRRHMGLMYYANRLFAGGVNKLVFHGSTYKFSDTENTYFPVTQTWPGYSAMSALSYGNEWDDKTPMWENVDIMTDALARYQMVLQQGQGDIDLAVYRSLYGKGNVRSQMTDIEKTGYTYDYVTPTVLNLENAVVGEQDGQVVLAADGPSYKALVIEPMNDGTVPPMPLDTAKKVLDAAKAGLPVVIIGDAPSRANTYPSAEADGNALVSNEDTQLAEYMDQLGKLDSVKSVANRTEAVEALRELGVAPDARPQKASQVYFQHRDTGNADLYYIYNDGTEDCAQSLTLKGQGVPYLLDPWSGEITPIAEYTTDGSSVTVRMDLEAQDAMVVAVAGEGWSSKTVKKAVAGTNADRAVYDETSDYSLAVQSAKGGNVDVKFADGSSRSLILDKAQDTIRLTDWTMILKQWTEGASVFETKVMPTEEFDLSQTGLVPWYEISSDLTNVAGVAKYTTTFDLEKGWEEGQGAYLEFTRVSDVGRLSVNGVEVPMNQLSLRTDVGAYLVAGVNKIEVEVSSNMSNVKYGKNDGNTYSFGVIGEVTLTPYTYAKVESEAKVAAEAAKAAETARKAAEDAKKAAEDAQGAAQDAQTEAEKAQKRAEDAKTEAKNAQTAAEAARNESGEHSEAAKLAQKAAEDAWTEAKNAQKLAEDARTAAEQAQTEAVSAKNLAQNAQGAAETAKKAAEDAQAGATDAQKAAERAKDDAVKAQGAAETARDAAVQAKDTAKSYKEAAEKSAESAKAQAKLAEAAKIAAIAAKEDAEKARSEAQAAQKIAEERAAAAEKARKAAQEARAAAEKALKEAQEARMAAQKAQREAEKSAFEARRAVLRNAVGAKKRKAKITWKRVAGAQGYQIQYALKPSFKGKKTITVKNVTAKSLKKLKSGKKYFVRMRAFKTFDGKEVYTDYSNVKKVKVK